HTHTLALTLTLTHKHAHTRAHTHTRTHTHTHTRTHAHTHTHTHREVTDLGQVLSLQSFIGALSISAQQGIRSPLTSQHTLTHTHEMSPDDFKGNLATERRAE